MNDFEVTEEVPDSRRRVMAILVAADLALRGVAARRAWRNKHRKWFFAMVLISSGGVLPLSYLLLFSRRGADDDALED